jgi:hypothetical protein
MDPTAPTAHAGHDELLIARLFDGDVTEAERDLALDVMSDCSECASLFADFGSIAEAAAALPIPARPRDFMLTEADAARLRRPSRRRWAMFGMGLRRSVGSSIAALGIVGVILTGASSVLSNAATTGNSGLSPERLAAAPDQGSVAVASGETPSYFGPKGVTTAAPLSAATAVPAPSSAPVAATVPSAGNVVPASSAAAPPAAGSTAMAGQSTASGATDTHDLAAASPAVAQGNFGGAGSTSGVPAGTVGPNGLDARLIWLAGFAALFIVGLTIAILPVRRRGRDRDVRP